MLFKNEETALKKFSPGLTLFVSGVKARCYNLSPIKFVVCQCFQIGQIQNLLVWYR